PATTTLLPYTTLFRSIRHQIAKRISEELEEGQIVNLGIGIPTIVTEYLGDKEIYLQTENGLLGMGPPPTEDTLDIDLINAGKEPDRKSTRLNSSHVKI